MMCLGRWWWRVFMCVCMSVTEALRGFWHILMECQDVTGCNGTPKVEWQKCDIHLCFTSTTNCFMKFYIGHLETHTCMHTCMNTHTYSRCIGYQRGMYVLHGFSKPLQIESPSIPTFCTILSLQSGVNCTLL